jgi:hypothetical protein
MSSLTVTGKVIAIDKAAKTFTLDPTFGRSLDRIAAGFRTFALDRNGIVLMGNERRDFNDLTIGDLVTVNYRQETTGKIIADHITVVPVGVPGPQASAMLPNTSCVCPQASMSPSGSALAADRTFEHEKMPYNAGFASGAAPFSLLGKVVAVDKSAKTITVDPSELRNELGPNKAAPAITTFVLDRNVSVYSGDRSMMLNDINVGDTVSVNYHQEGDGKIIADSIAINPDLPLERG